MHWTLEGFKRQWDIHLQSPGNRFKIIGYNHWTGANVVEVCGVYVAGAVLYLKGDYSFNTHIKRSTITQIYKKYLQDPDCMYTHWDVVFDTDLGHRNFLESQSTIHITRPKYAMESIITDVSRIWVFDAITYDFVTHYQIDKIHDTKIDMSVSLPYKHTFSAIYDLGVFCRHLNSSTNVCMVQYKDGYR